MRDTELEELKRWVEAEGEAPWDEADALFASVARRHLPRLAQPRDLGSTVMAAIARSSGASPVRWALEAVSQGWVRFALVASVVVLGLALALASGTRVFEAAAGGIEALAGAAHVAATAIRAGAGVAVAAWTLFVSLSRTAALVASTGSAQTLIAANLLLAFAAFAGLSRLLTPREEYK